MLLTDKYADKIYGTITCYDRMIIQGYIPGWSHAEGMTGYLNANNIRIFDFSNFSQPLTEQIRANPQCIADENGIEIEFIRKLRAFRKDGRIQEIIRTAIFTVKPDNIATFLGQRITYNCKKEVGTNYNQRILGTRLKHHMGDVSIKMYDKFGHVLRIESTCNDIGAFRVKRKVEHRDGSSTEQKAPLKKSIYSLYQLFTIMKAANYRYLEFISTFDDHSNGNGNLTRVTSPVIEKERSYRGINFFAGNDLKVLEVIGRGEYMTFGMQGKDIRQHLGNISPSAMSRIFKRLRLHRIIERVQGTYKYFATAYGKEIITGGNCYA